MTRKDYERIARVLNAFSSMDTSRPLGLAVAVIADSLALVFAADNPRFSRDRFLAVVDVQAKYFANSEKEAA